MSKRKRTAKRHNYVKQFVKDMRRYNGLIEQKKSETTVVGEKKELETRKYQFKGKAFKLKEKSYRRKKDVR